MQTRMLISIGMRECLRWTTPSSLRLTAITCLACLIMRPFLNCPTSTGLRAYQCVYIVYLTHQLNATFQRNDWYKLLYVYDTEYLSTVTVRKPICNSYTCLCAVVMTPCTATHSHDTILRLFAFLSTRSLDVVQILDPRNTKKPRDKIVLLAGKTEEGEPIEKVSAHVRM